MYDFVQNYVTINSTSKKNQPTLDIVCQLLTLGYYEGVNDAVLRSLAIQTADITVIDAKFGVFMPLDYILPA